MSIFISWSGVDSTSHRIAKLLRDWIPKVIQRTECYLSSEDNAAGIVWIRTVFEHLEESQFGILCVTAQSLESPWMNFEARAIAKRTGDARLCPLLIDMKPSEVKGPLAAFQMKTLSREDLFEVIKMVNSDHQEKALQIPELEESFNIRWPLLEKEIKGILSENHKPHAKKRSVDDRLDEILNGVRTLLSYSTPQSSVPGRSETAVTIFEKLLQFISQKRPLIRPWLDDALPANNQGCLLLNSARRQRGSG